MRALTSRWLTAMAPGKRLKGIKLKTSCLMSAFFMASRNEGRSSTELLSCLMRSPMLLTLASLKDQKIPKVHGHGDLMRLPSPVPIATSPDPMVPSPRFLNVK